MTNGKTAAAQALHSMLSAFHALADKSLKAVRKIHEEESLSKVILDFGSIALFVIAEEDDSIDFRIAATTDYEKTIGIDASSEEPWRQIIGKTFGWGWIAINQQGYSDGVLLSFKEVIFPEIVLTVVASALKVGRVEKVS
jgi:hypothetical protein